MKRLTSVIALLVAAFSYGVDSITVDNAGGNIARITYNWTSDGSGNATGRTTTVVPGVLHSVIFTPSGSAAPTDNYDVVVKGAVQNLDDTYTTINYDEAGSQCLNRDTATAETVYFYPESTLPHTGFVVIEVTNAGSAKAGRIELFIERTMLPIANLPYGIPTGGSSGQIIQWESSGNGKWITLSGDATIADGGAVTVSASGLGDVDGPASSTDRAIAIFNGLTGKILQNSDLTISATGELADGNSSLTLNDAVVITGTTDAQGDVSDSTGAYTISDANVSLSGAGVSLVIGANTGAPSVDMNGAAGTNRIISRVQSAGANRWISYVTSAAESGANAGSLWEVGSYTDAAAYSTVIRVNRITTDPFSIDRPLDVSSSITAGSSNVLITTTGGNLALTAPAGTAATTKILGSDGTNTAWVTPKTKAFVLGARSGEATTTNGAAAPSKTTAAGGREYYTMSFADDADRIAQWETVLPADYGGGTITATFYWTVASGSGTVIWGIQACSSTDDETIDQTYGTAVETTDTIIAAADEHVVTSSAVTIGGSPAAGHTVNFYIYRQNSDTATVAALLRAVKCEYTPLPY